MSEQPPSFNELVAALKTLQEPEARRAPGDIAKHAATLVGAIMLALCIWVGASVTSLSGTTTQAVTKLTSIEKQLEEVRTDQASSNGRLGDIRTEQVKQGERIGGLEQGQSLLRDRIRILEGQRPLEGAGERP